MFGLRTVFNKIPRKFTKRITLSNIIGTNCTNTTKCDVICLTLFGKLNLSNIEYITVGIFIYQNCTTLI